MSTITDSDGQLRAQLRDVEGIVCADVQLAPERRRIPPMPSHDYWSFTRRPDPDAVAAVYIELERAARRAYADARDQRLVAIAELRERSYGR